MDLLKVENLSKTYKKFKLDNVSFEVPEGYIMGFIGRNGAGKTTTLKSMLNLVHADSGKVEICSMDFAEQEFECKQNIGLVLGEVDYYSAKKLSTIADVTKRFYPNWDNVKFAESLKTFNLDPSKKVKELSAGMKVKFSLAMALSHHARLLILDEPTSGLDPVSRDELIEIFRTLIEDGEHSILFSTHIISDLEKCADYITYIHNGRILATDEFDSFVGKYRSISGGEESLTPELEAKLIGCRKHKFGFEAVIKTEDVPSGTAAQIEKTDLETIMVHIERE